MGSTSMMFDEEIEPYVRRKKADGVHSSRKKMAAMDPQEQNQLRNSINSRERRRMHELNEEFEALRECLPYTQDANCRRMSKANTLLLASNWIKQLTNANHVLQSELDAAKAQITSLLEKTSTPKCPKCDKNACFSVSCITGSK